MHQNRNLEIVTQDEVSLRFSFDRVIFNTEKYRHLSFQGEWKSFYLINLKRGYVCAEFHLAIDSEVAYSPYKASFGGPSADLRLRQKDFHWFLSECIKRITESGIKKIEIVPVHHKIDGHVFSNSLYTLQKLGFKLVNTEIHSMIRVGKKVFEDTVLDKELKRRLKKCRKAEFKYSKVKNLEECNEIFDFIANCRKKKNYNFSMSKEFFEKQYEAFPGRLLGYVVRDSKRIIAAAICTQVNNDILYDFAHAHDSVYNEYSPIVLLIEGIYDSCYIKRIKYIDLGSSELNEFPNDSLRNFKENFSRISSVKVKLESVLS